MKYFVVACFKGDISGERPNKHKNNSDSSKRTTTSHKKKKPGNKIRSRSNPPLSNRCNRSAIGWENYTRIHHNGGYSIGTGSVEMERNIQHTAVKRIANCEEQLKLRSHRSRSRSIAVGRSEGCLTDEQVKSISHHKAAQETSHSQIEQSQQEERQAEAQVRGLESTSLPHLSNRYRYERRYERNGITNNITVHYNDAKRGPSKTSSSRKARGISNSNRRGVTSAPVEHGTQLRERRANHGKGNAHSLRSRTESKNTSLPNAERKRRARSERRMKSKK